MVTPTWKGLSVRLLGAVFVLLLLIAACSTNATTPTTALQSTSSTQAGGASALEVLRYGTAADEIAAPTLEPPAAILTLTGCQQVDIATWHLTGTAEAAEWPTTGWIRFDTAAAAPSDIEIGVGRPGPFSIDVQTPGLADLAFVCALLFPGEDQWVSHTETAAQPFEGVYVFDAEPGTVASLGVGLVAGDTNDRRRAWAVQHYFGPALPFPSVLAVNDTLTGVARVRDIAVSASSSTPCRQIILALDKGTVTQSQSCFGQNLGLPEGLVGENTEWQSFGSVEGVTFTHEGAEWFVGTAAEWTVTISASAVGDLIEIASSLTTYANPGYFAPTVAATGYPESEDIAVEALIGPNMREVERIEASGGKLVILEGPLNPIEDFGFLSELRIYRLSKAGEFWNPLLIAGGSWNRCLAVLNFNDGTSLVITGDSALVIEMRQNGVWESLDGTGRLQLIDDTVAAEDTRIKDGQNNDCSTGIVLVPVATTVIQTTDTTIGDGTTDTSTP